MLRKLITLLLAIIMVIFVIGMAQATVYSCRAFLEYELDHSGIHVEFEGNWGHYICRGLYEHTYTVENGYWILEFPSCWYDVCLTPPDTAKWETLCWENSYFPPGTYDCLENGKWDTLWAKLPRFDIVMHPYDPPVVVPQCGSFRYTGILKNNYGMPGTVDVWIEIGGLYEARKFLNIPIEGNQEIIVENIRQRVPCWVPPDVYSYCVYVGDYPDDVIDSYCFNFTVTEAFAGGGGVNEWQVDAWFDYEAVSKSSTTSVLSNTPNPFNATTSIMFNLTEETEVKLEVYDLLGRRVATLADGAYNAGEHSVTWDASDYSSGVYFYRLEAGDEVFTKRMTLLK